MSFFISSAYAQATTAAAPEGFAGGGMMQGVLLVGFMAVFYFLILRPQMKRSKEHKNLLGGLQKGDEVVTTGGIIGKVVKVSDGFVVLAVSDSIQLRFQKAAIVATLPKGTLKAIDD